MTTTKEKESKYEVSYEEISMNNKNGLDVLPQVFTIENCEIYASSIGAQKTGFSKNIRFVLPDAEFKAIDRKICNYFTQQRQAGNADCPPDPNCENHKTCVKEITKKDILDGKFPENLEGKYTLNVYTTTCVMYGTKLNAKTGEPETARVKEMKETIDGKILYKHFSVNDEFSGQPIVPAVYKFQNGEKVTTFKSPKTGAETPFYLGKNDIVNIKVRPYDRKNELNGDWACKYNLLEVEIVQTAFDRGKSGFTKSNKPKEDAKPMSFEGLSSMFAGSVETVSTPAPKAVKVETPKVEMPAVEFTTGVAGQAPEVKEVKAELPKAETTTAPMFDFSQLGADLGNMNLGV